MSIVHVHSNQWVCRSWNVKKKSFFTVTVPSVLSVAGPSVTLRYKWIVQTSNTCYHGFIAVEGQTNHYDVRWKILKEFRGPFCFANCTAFVTICHSRGRAPLATYVPSSKAGVGRHAWMHEVWSMLWIIECWMGAN